MKMKKVLLCVTLVLILVITGCTRRQTDETSLGVDLASQSEMDDSTVAVRDTLSESKGKETQTQYVDPEIADAIDGNTLGIVAQSALLYDVTDDQILVYKNIHHAVYPASTTKLLTALVAMDYIPADAVITAGDELDLVEPNSSLAYIQKGQQLDRDTLLEALLVPSGNDAAYIIAAYVGRIAANNQELSVTDAVNQFVLAMNQKAEQLGMKESHFSNPDGYDDATQQVTAKDLMILAREFIKNPVLLDVVGRSNVDATFASGEVISWENTNELIAPASVNFMDNCFGIKTGSSAASGYCLVSAAFYNGNQYISVVMNSSKEGRWSDSKTLLSYPQS